MPETKKPRWCPHCPTNGYHAPENCPERVQLSEPDLREKVARAIYEVRWPNNPGWAWEKQPDDTHEAYFRLADAALAAAAPSAPAEEGRLRRDLEICREDRTFKHRQVETLAARAEAAEGRGRETLIDFCAHLETHGRLSVPTSWAALVDAFLAEYDSDASERRIGGPGSPGPQPPRRQRRGDHRPDPPPCAFCDGYGDVVNPGNADPALKVTDWLAPVGCPRCGQTGKDPNP